MYQQRDELVEQLCSMRLFSNKPPSVSFQVVHQLTLSVYKYTIRIDLKQRYSCREFLLNFRYNKNKKISEDVMVQLSDNNQVKCNMFVLNPFYEV